MADRPKMTAGYATRSREGQMERFPPSKKTRKTSLWLISSRDHLPRLDLEIEVVLFWGQWAQGKR